MDARRRDEWRIIPGEGCTSPRVTRGLTSIMPADRDFHSGSGATRVEAGVSEGTYEELRHRTHREAFGELAKLRNFPQWVCGNFDHQGTRSVSNLPKSGLMRHFTGKAMPRFRIVWDHLGWFPPQVVPVLFLSVKSTDLARMC
jgi:hypothetical protein